MDFPFTVVGDLETTTGYISELEGGSVLATSYCIMFNFHPSLEMTPVLCSRSFGQNEEELKFVTIREDYFQYIDTDDYRCFLDQCDEVPKKQKKNKPSPHYALSKCGWFTDISVSILTPWSSLITRN